jgi:hypothetical protein
MLIIQRLISLGLVLKYFSLIDALSILDLAVVLSNTVKICLASVFVYASRTDSQSYIWDNVA